MGVMHRNHFERLAKSLGANYRLIKLLGSGGAAHVYVAEHRRTGQLVAIKALRAEEACNVSAARFLAEIDIVAQLDHRNIVPLLGAGTADGLPYYVMPLIAGQSLRGQLEHRGRLPLRDVLDICANVSAALDYAHEQRVVHRDIKPENILFQRDRALVVDFGIAFALDVSAHPRLTMPGASVGTPEYMSPEQAHGDGTLDGRSDVYSLACVAYEMLWGRPPFIGTPRVVMLRQISAEPMPLGCRLPWLPQSISAAVSRALSKSPSSRFATPGSFIDAMRAGLPPDCLGATPQRVAADVRCPSRSPFDSRVACSTGH
jgi:serine/threonine protein kinase